MGLTKMNKSVHSFFHITLQSWGLSFHDTDGGFSTNALMHCLLDLPSLLCLTCRGAEEA